MRQTKFLSGWYRVSGQHHFSNVKRSTAYGRVQWSVDLRRGHDGELVQLAGLWDSKREGVEEAERIIARADALYVPSPAEL